MLNRSISTLTVLLFSGLAAMAAPLQPPKPPAQPRAERPPMAARLANAPEARKRLGLVPGYDNVPGIENIKIAVLDYGFDGINGAHRYLPGNAALVENYDPDFVRRYKLGDPDYRKSFAAGNGHGRTMAQIIWAMAGFPANGPRFYLLNANGPTMLRRAVRYAMDAKVDIILFCGTFEGGGNGDGRGPINRIASDAIAAGILWINAAGNYGGHVFNGPVVLGKDGFLQFGQRQALRFRNLLDENTVTITLTWNDYREEEDAGTSKDLDLYIEDWSGRQVGLSAKVQVTSGKLPGAEETRNPRERVVLADLAASPDRDYRIRIRARGGSFTAADRLRVLVTSSREAYVDPKTGLASEAIQFLDATGRGEIYPPADNPLVITIGDANPFSSRGPTTDYRVKPDVVLEDSRAVFSNGEMTEGASNAAAYFAGTVALMKAAEPGLSTRHLLWFAHYGPQPQRAAVTQSASNPPARTPAPSPRLPPPRPDNRSARDPTRPANPNGAANAPSRTANFAELRPPSRNVLPSPQGVPTPRRLWQTPTRQQLADEVRLDR